GDDRVDAIGERAADPPLVSEDGGGHAPALTALGALAARAGIRRRGEHEPARQLHGVPGAHDRHRAVLERLAKGLERVARKLAQLVEEEDTAVRERDLPSPRRGPPAHETGGR